MLYRSNGNYIFIAYGRYISNKYTYDYNMNCYYIKNYNENCSNGKDNEKCMASSNGKQHLIEKVSSFLIFSRRFFFSAFFHIFLDKKHFKQLVKLIKIIEKYENLPMKTLNILLFLLKTIKYDCGSWGWS